MSGQVCQRLGIGGLPIVGTDIGGKRTTPQARPTDRAGLRSLPGAVQAPWGGPRKHNARTRTIDFTEPRSWQEEAVRRPASMSPLGLRPRVARQHGKGDEREALGYIAPGSGG
jgi:hypothetical protein